MAEYGIREISEIFHLPSSTLRYYEEIGILTNIARTSSGQRIFTDAHVNRLKTICCFKNTGMTIAQLKSFFIYESAEQEHIDDIISLLNAQKEYTVEQINRFQTGKTTSINLFFKLSSFFLILSIFSADSKAVYC